ncbi:hypothetical protein CathTA2_1000 [Caldalkalibacillus thermarum TA2.A1]|uniref:Uncharacterized protein n=1 Tax=Caldalkalibacillus thermarum (strain TA2.A1) TaxID=986075 RepID=F5L5D7_CALTT|nr:hypothetical protein [Caldalkalibacillus thermarum]EGL83436.1 hypothetical protein CathTA2_1000 [Caldalkalibacillus thermarum TA2.A1]QZT34676.1 hypothetical protein HUR95_04880 [Caldalkalibacillus thermarum TA2.A1]
MLGWNTYSRYHIEDNWTDNFISELRTHRHEIESLADQASGELKEDLINAVSLLNIAMEEKDVVALLYVHRILHDLDVFIYGYDAEMFMYTKTIHDNDRIDAYIAKKQ